MLYISIFCIFCRFFCLLTIKIFFPKKSYLTRFADIKQTVLCFCNPYIDQYLSSITNLFIFRETLSISYKCVI